MEKLSSGNSGLNAFLGGGYERGVVTTIYGPGGSGKTLFLLLAMSQVPENKKIIYVDTEGGLSIDRMAQILPDYNKVLEKTVFLKPTKFEEQKEAIDNLKTLSSQGIGLVIVDTLTTLYRIEMTPEDNYGLNKDLARQLMSLVEIARKKEIPVLVTGQVYSSVEEKDKINIIGGAIVRNMSKCLLEIKKDKSGRKLAIKKHRSLPEKEISFSIVEKGIEIA